MLNTVSYGDGQLVHAQAVQIVGNHSQFEECVHRTVADDEAAIRTERVFRVRMMPAPEYKQWISKSTRLLTMESNLAHLVS